jgi:hypothetical protein
MGTRNSPNLPTLRTKTDQKHHCTRISGVLVLKKEVGEIIFSHFAKCA